MNKIIDEARRRGVTRLCHFTKAANLAHIIATRELRDTALLEASDDSFRPSDMNRRDGHRGHICLSLEYPNSWYLQEARNRDLSFPDWVVITLDISILETPGARFCPHNAARLLGAGIRDGATGFNSLFSDRVGDRYRNSVHPPWWPTDDQAEILIPGPISSSFIRSVITQSDEQAELETFRLKLQFPTEDIPPLDVAPVLFQPRELSWQVRRGNRPIEMKYTHE
ncbi:DarT ssDNA thymidine ADP-ribosyltransferase family protein [Amycolatopsis suaedae]|uniref:DUF4433 domain-containing protein n=1 Tax=Amycolatopsis suaedae TaxID=2510978 RepID=A0A4Q7J8S3_9PSEU|nr:DUF4433 domain-containing protein [Amycolatopsis suaedae]